MTHPNGAVSRLNAVVEFVMVRVAVAALFAGGLAAGCAVEAGPSHLGGLTYEKSEASFVEAVRADGSVGYARAESRFGHGSVSGPVRRTARGLLEVRMPGGTWIDCGRNCSDTLRRETVDFWESRDSKGQPGPAAGFTWRWGY